MSISERITGTIENWRTLWGEALKSFLVRVLSFGFEVFMDIVGKAAAPKLKPFVDMIEATGKVPPELQPLLNELKSPTGEVGALFAQSAGSALIGGAIGKIIDSILLPMAYAVSSVTRNVELSDTQMLALWLRNNWTPDELDKKLSWLGVPSDNVENLKTLTQIRLDPNIIMIAWRRKIITDEQLTRELKDQGFDDSRIATFKEATLFLPSADEQTLWLAREVYEPDMVSKYGLGDEMPIYEDTDFSKIGVSPEQMSNKWKAHWEHASFMQMVEMLHRGLIEESDFWEWFKLVEVVPYWRDKLIKTVYTWPTRVDVRRFWDMRTITEERLRELYEGMGYRDQNLEDYIKWTKVYTDFPMMLARFTKGWITQEEVKSWLLAQGIPEERAQHFIEEKIKPEGAERVAKERDLTKSEIYKMIKADILSHSQGIELIIDMGYSRAEAENLIEVNVEVLTGSPDTYMEIKKWTQLYRQSQGQTANIPSLELIQAERDVNQAEKALRKAKEQGIKGTELSEMERAAEVTKIAYHHLLQQFTAS